MVKTFSGRKPSQHPEEIGAFIDLMRSRGVRRYLEIGARHGDTFHQVMMSLPKGAFGAAVDFPGGAWGVESSRRSLEAAAGDLEIRGYRADVLFGDSASQEIISAVSRMAPFDAILIDGDHRLAGVTADWENYGALGDLVAFHDIAGAGLVQKTHGYHVEVPTLWERLKADLDTVEFIAQGSRMGIGVVMR